MENDQKLQKKGRKPKTTKSEDDVILDNFQKELEIEITETTTAEIEEFIEKINQEIENPAEEMKEAIEDIMEEVKNIVSTVEEKKDEINNSVSMIENKKDEINNSVSMIENKKEEIKTIVEEKTAEIIEQVAEQVINKMIEIKSLLNLLIIISVREDMQKKYGLTPELVKILQSIIQQNSSFFIKIEESFKKIVEDNKIDSQDVPELMNLFSNVYELIFSLKLKISTLEMSNICGELIKLTFNIMLDENLIIFDSLSKELTRTTFNALVDSSISLIKLSKTVKITNKCCVMW